MRQEIETAITATVQELFNVHVDVELSRPDEQFGDYATNVALQLAQQVDEKPRDIAEALATKLSEKLAGKVPGISVAGPGFLNLRVSDQVLLAGLLTKPAQTLAGKTVVAEYSDPNPFKVLHAGHLYTSVVGDAVANLLEAAGGNVHRVNYGGDVGLHVGKTLWAILQALGGEEPEKLAAIPEAERPDWLAARYVEGTDAYEDNEAAKAAIISLNKQVYQMHAANDHASPLAQIYWTCRQWSYDYFDSFYARIGSHFEKYYPESQVADIGLAIVREQLAKGVYEESDGAVVFKGETYGMHTRVFINSQGLPTYEAKEVGVMMAKWDDYHFDKSVIITGNDIVDYMRVVLKSIEQFQPELVTATAHLPHGNVKLAGGVKMSSRKGNILRAVDVLDAASEASQQLIGHADEPAVLGAVKYAFLKQRIGGDIIYDPKESVSLEGNSGPYLQYAHARARSILAKASLEDDVTIHDLGKDERSLVRKIGEYSEVVDRAVTELMPHHVCTYLYELAQTFNRFYENNRVVGSDRQGIRLRLVEAYAETLKNGLALLGMSAPEKM
jgi:arginyl-tRNA synthetase